MELSWEDAKEAFREVLEEEFGGGHVRIAPKWDGGKMILTPFDSSLQPKEVPLNAFFKKITAVREKLRVLERQPRAVCDGLPIAGDGLRVGGKSVEIPQTSRGNQE